MLLNNYYIIHSCTCKNDEMRFRVQLLPDSEVYRGHFPDNPIAPGVCNIQMIIECASQVLGFEVTIQSIRQCRFLKLLVPGRNKLYDLVIKTTTKDTEIELEASLTKGLTPYIQFKGEVIKKN